MSPILIQVILGGLLTGFIYVLISLGLTLIYGVMDICNFAHGDFLTLAMYAAFMLNVGLGLDPIVSLPFVTILVGLFGTIVYWFLIKKVLHSSGMAQIFVTFGLMIFIRGCMQAIFSANYRTIQEPLISGSIFLGPIAVSKPQLIVSIGAILGTVLVYLFISKTKTGWALQAVSENREASSLMGINVQKMFILAWGLGAGCVGVAGALMSEYYYIYPEVGAVFGSISFITVALGGFGSISGVFIAGLLIGMTEVLGGFFLTPAFKYLLVYSLYFVIIVVRPQGLKGKQA